MTKITAPVVDPTERPTEEHRDDIPCANSKGILTYTGAELADLQPNREPIQQQETEPHGMFWHRSHTGGPLVLSAHAWFYKQVSATAELIVAEGCAQFAKDEELQACIAGMADALREYVGYRNAINQMAGARKLSIEADDACYQFCQAAKYYVDATEKAQFRLARGESIDDQQIQGLKTRSTEAMREGYALSQAIIRASDTPPQFDFDKAAKRVVDYSCRKLTEWFAARRQNNERSEKLNNAGAALELANFFKAILPPRAA